MSDPEPAVHLIHEREIILKNAEDLHFALSLRSKASL